MTDHNRPEKDDSRDILIALRSDVGHLVDAVKHFQQSDMKQWEKLDNYGVKLGELAKDVQANANEIKSHKETHWRWTGVMLAIPTALVGLWTLLVKALKD